MMTLGRWLALLLMTTLLGAKPMVVHAAYPERPVTMIVAYSAGGGTDLLARMVAPFIARHLGAEINVVNQPGAGGEVGFTNLASAAPDGYTIGFVNTPNLLTIPIERTAQYSLASFAPVALLVEDPTVLVVNAGSPTGNLRDLAAAAGQSGAPTTIGTTGAGSPAHLAALRVSRGTGVTLRAVPFPGVAASREALLGNHIATVGMGISEAMADANAGRVRILGVMARERWEQAPDVPTFREQGFDIVLGSGRGIAAPAGVSPAILQIVARSVEQAVHDPEFIAKARENFVPLHFLGTSAFAQYLNDADREYRALWQSDPWR